MHISAWKTLVNKSSIDTERQRKIFLHKKDVAYLI
jgi:tmRNA-binding protein